MRAGLGLAVVLAIGFGADALVMVTTRARADGAAVPGAQVKIRPWASAMNLSKAARLGGAETWSMAMIGITLALAVCGGIVAGGRRLLPQGTGVALHVVGRVSLSPRHSVYVLRVGRRMLLVGAGPQGAPTLISELDDVAELAPDPPEGEQP